MESHIINWVRSYDNIFSIVANLLSVTNTMDESNESILQAITSLFSDILMDALFHMGEKISDLPDLNDQTDMVEIARRWGEDIIEKGAKTIS